MNLLFWLWLLLALAAPLVLLRGVRRWQRLSAHHVEARGSKRERRKAYWGARDWLSGLVRRRFGGYVHALLEVDETLPLQVPEEPSSRPRVAIVGAGLAGLGAACDLSERGFSVALLEKNAYLGGKIGAFLETAADGTVLEVEHGFHAFFRHYYNLRAFLQRTGVHEHLVPVQDYLILETNGQAWSFRDVETTPVLNLLALARRGLYRLREVLLTPLVHQMDVFLTYDPLRTFSQLDHVSYAQFARRAKLPEKLKLVFNTFARSFFADEERLSMAELIKSFHFYYLSHDHGLLYDYPNGDYQRTVLDPIRSYLESRNVHIRLRQPCRAVVPHANGGYEIDGELFDYVIMATDSVGARAILEASPALRALAPALATTVAALRPGQRYAVWRIWIDRDARAGLPVFISTERLRVLDSVTLHHHITRTAAHDRTLPPGHAVLELHCYAVPDELDETELRAALASELVHHFPELAGFQIRYEAFQLRADFTAFHIGMNAMRPETRTELAGLYLAGDWVRLPCPAMLMEAAYTSGLLATNAILRDQGLRPYPVLSVPLHGLLSAARKQDNQSSA